MPSPRSAANPASQPPLPREHLPGLLPVTASRLVTGLSRASCRDASGLAVLMSTGRRAGLPGLSRPAAPAPPGGQALAHHRPGPSDRHLLPLPGRYHRPGGVAGAGLALDPGRRPHCGSPASARQPAAAVGCRVSRTRGVGPARTPSRPREWTAARQMGPGDTPGCLVGCPACSRAAPTRRSGLQAMFLWRGREGSLGVGCSRIARGRQGAAASR